MNKNLTKIILSFLSALLLSGAALFAFNFGMPSAVRNKLDELEEKHSERVRGQWTETKITGNMNPLDIVGASALVIVPPSVGAQGFFTSGIEEPTSRLFKITDNGDGMEYKEVTYTRTETVRIENEEGEIEEYEEEVDITHTVFPVAIIDLNENYFIACFNEEADDVMGYIEYNYLVRKHDGAVFVMPDSRPLIGTIDHVYRNMFANEDFSDFIQTDGEGNIYYLCPAEVNRLNIEDPENITYEPLTQALYQHERGVYNYRVNSQGHIKYFHLSDSGSLQVLVRINQDPPSLIYFFPDDIPFWVGFDGEIYREKDGVIKRLRIFSNTHPPYELENVGTLEISDPDTEYVCFEEPYIFKISNSTQIITVGSYANGRGDHLLVAEVYDSTRTFRLSELGLSSIKMGINSDKYYYLAGLNHSNVPVLIRVDPAEYTPENHHEYMTLLEGYDIYKMSVSSDDVVTFNAQRLSPMSIVLGQVSDPDNETIIEENAPQVHQLVQIQ